MFVRKSNRSLFKASERILQWTVVATQENYRLHDGMRAQYIKLKQVLLEAEEKMSKLDLVIFYQNKKSELELNVIIVVIRGRFTVRKLNPGHFPCITVQHKRL